MVTARKTGRGGEQARAGILFVAPSMAIFSVFVFIPLLVSFAFSLMNLDMMFQNVQFEWFDNYQALFKDKRFWNALQNTAYYTALVVPLTISLSLITAALLGVVNRRNTLIKSVFFLPAICSMTIVSIVWTFLIDKDIGIFSYWLSRIGIEPIALLKSPVWAMPTIILLGVWKNFGFNMVILIAGLQGISDTYYEAAEIDGAGAVRKFFSITVPLLMPTLTFTLVNSVIASFQIFDQVHIMTHGGPMFKTETVVQYIYQCAFTKFDMGYASTVAVMLFVVTFCLSIYLFQNMRKDEGDLT